MNMKKLSETWKQTKHLGGASSSKYLRENAATITTSTKRLGRVAIQPNTSKYRSTSALGSSEIKVKVVSAAADICENPGCSFSTSFGPDLDKDLIKAAESLEAAACLASNNGSLRGGSGGQHPALVKSPSRQKEVLAACTIPGKRKSTRRSGFTKHSLFGVDRVSGLAAEALTPTHSPCIKKRKDSDQSFLLCPASPSPETLRDQHHSSGGASPRLHSSARGNLAKAAELKNGGDKTGTLKEDDDMEIETDISPVLIVSENSSKSACSKTVARQGECITQLSPKLTRECRLLKVNDQTRVWKSETIKSKHNFQSSGQVSSSGLESDENLGSRTPSRIKPDRALTSVKNLTVAHSACMNPKVGPAQGSNNSKADHAHSQFTGLRQGKRIILHDQSASIAALSPSKLAEPKISGSETAEPKMAGSESTEPKKAGSGAAEPKMAGSETAESKMESSETAEPKTASSDSVDRKMAGSESVIDVVYTSAIESQTSSVTVLPRALHASELETKDRDVRSSVHRKHNSLKSIVAAEQTERHSESVPESSMKAHSHAGSSAVSETGKDREGASSLESALPPSGSQSVSKIGSQNADSLLLAMWGLPSPVLEAYHGQGISTMFPWQAECLTVGNVLNGGNLVYSAPTSAGKTMVAELLILKRVLETRRKALFILPFVSVTREKMISLQRLFQDAGVRVGGFMGSHSPVGGLRSVDVAVCTIEKGNGLVNRLMEESRMDELGVVVIDELHMVGDSSRGYLLELLLTKISYMSRKSRESSGHGIQVIGMSATLPNLDLLSTWLDADLYHTDFRPVPLTQNIKVGTTIYNDTMTKVREIDLKMTFQGDEDHIIPLCLETIMGGHSVLIFCPTKAWCEKMAEKIAREFYGLMKNPTALAAYTSETGFIKASEMVHLPIDQASLHNVVEQLRRSPAGVDPMLGKVLKYAVAYHHAGLTFDERDIVEGAFRQGMVKVLVATSTLSSGVNLPARRVIVRSLLFGGRLMDALSYKQMAGRAGRKGVDTEGECVLVCKEGERRMAQSLLKSDLPPVTSCLHSAGDTTQLSRSMKRAILEVVVSGVASTPEDVSRYVSCTLLSASLPSDDSSTAQLVTACLHFLQDNEFVTLHTATDSEGREVQKYQPTQLGSAVLASSMSPDEGLAVFTELHKARQCFVLANELHIIYLVTPIYSQEISGNMEWYHFYCLWDSLTPDMRLVARTVGVEEAFLAKAVTGRVPSKTAAQMRAVAIHKRFYTALALHDLVQEVPLLDVASKYNCNKGQLQSLMQSAATFAGMVTVFCARLGWSNMELLFSQFQQRLTLGVTRELCDLVRIPLLTGSMARWLFNAGYHTIAAVAHAVPEDLEIVFRNASPFQSTKRQDGETDWDMEERRRARCVWLVGHRGVTELEAATAIISEAKALIQQELGVQVHWKQQGVYSKAADMSASRTVLDGDLSKQSPHCGTRNSSVASESSPAVTGEQGGITITPDSAPNRLKRKSPGSAEFQTPVSSHQAKRLLSSCSMLRRTGKGKSFVKRSPLSDSCVAVPRAAHEKARSPQDVSFFGQVVVSPPAYLKLKKRVTPDTQKEVNGASCEQVPVYNQLSPVLSAVFQDRQVLKSVSQDLHHSCEHSPDSQKEGMVRTQIKSDNDQNNHMHCDTHRPTTSCDLTRENQEQKSVQDKQDLSSGLRNKEVHTAEAKNSVIGAQDEGTYSLFRAPSSARDTLPEAEPTVSAGQDGGGDDGFDDSLILNTQTDKLLAGHLNECNITRGQPFDIVAASTPLGALRSVMRSSEDLQDSKSAEGCVSNERLSGNEESPGNRNQVSAGVSKLLMMNTQHDKLPHTTALHFHGSHHNLSSQPEDSLTDDMFTSPFSSLSHPTNCLQPSSSKQTEQSGMVTKAKQTEHSPDPGQLEYKNNSRTEASQLPDENSMMQSDCGLEAEQSAELIPASNYERVACLEEGMIDSSADNSYQDLMSSVKSGACQLVCSDRDPEERAETCLQKRGQWQNSQTEQDKTKAEADPGQDGQLVSTQCYNIQENLAIAANMSDSFTSSVSSAAAAWCPGNVGPKAEVPPQPLQSYCAPVDDFSTSFTMSMMDKAFAEELLTEAASETCLEKGRPSQKTQRLQEVFKVEGQRTESTVKKSPQCSDESFCAVETAAELEGKRSSISKNPARKLKSSPRSSEEFVPPTPPEESCEVLSPHVFVRRTPVRSCRVRVNHHQTENIASMETKKRRTKDKENVHTKHSPHSIQKKRSVRENAGAAKSQSNKENAQTLHKVPSNGDNAQALHLLKSAKENGQATHRLQTLQKTVGRTRDSSTTSENLATQEVGEKNLDTASDLNSIPCRLSAMKAGSTVGSDINSALDSNKRETNIPTSSNSAQPDNHTDKDMTGDMDSLPLSQNSLCIIDVCSNTQLFAVFTAEWRSKKYYSISLACEKKMVPAQAGVGIGSNFVQGRGECRGKEVDHCGAQGVTIPGDVDRVIVGLAVSWAGSDAYYISFTSDFEESQEADDTLAAPPSTQSISQGQRIQTVKEILDQTQKKGTSHTAVVCDSKATYTVMGRGLGFGFGRCRDPLLASWLLDPGPKDTTLHCLVTNILPSDLPFMEGVGGCVGYGSLGLSTQSSVSGRLRAVTESIVGRRLMDHLWGQLTQTGLTTAFTHTEMPTMTTLARMELNGFGFSDEECERQKDLMLARLSSLEQEAYTLAGHPFTLTSTDDIAQVLYLELRLPVNGDPSAPKPQVRTLGPRRRAPCNSHHPKSSFSTSKDVLEKLKSYHPLPAVVLEWRRISSALTKHVYPLQKEKVYVERLGMHRIFSESQMHTATGRVSMMEPNLQNIPKDFDITLPDVIEESPPAVSLTTCHRRGGGSTSRLQMMRGLTPQKARVSNPATATHTAVSMRHAFVPFSGGVVLAADYSQLELRVIAHLSGDPKLTSILSNDGDVFKLIAAQWKNTLPEVVTAEERQHAKQICYGMLYGIGPKALGEQIGVDENDAAVFVESFKAKYTGMRSYLRRTVEQCRESGYVTTVTGRRRYLPAIRDTNPHARAQAERQAVNTTVQGSAADIVKAAMNAVDRRLAEVFPDTAFPHTHHHAESEHRRGAFLLLQLHDELIYEVTEADLHQVATIVSDCMEKTTPLTVPLPVKVRAGPSWGCLHDMQL